VIELLLEAERALSFGRVERAEQLYRQVAAADPKNSIAVVGLARVSLERADDLGAYLLARRALLIDPENEAARRLAQRLEEVMRTRGDSVPETAPVADQAARPSTSISPADAPPAGPSTPAAEADPARRRSMLDRIRRR
jgi:thioredoxin-like negative regulator of GroEL